MNKTIVISLLGASLLTGCSERSNSLTSLQGKECFVTYRRDALGYATDKGNPVDADTIWSGRAGELAARGRLKEAGADWVVLETKEGLHAIPASSILAVREIK